MHRFVASYLTTNSVPHVTVAAYDHNDDTEYNDDFKDLVALGLIFGQPVVLPSGAVSVGYNGHKIDIQPEFKNAIVKKHRIRSKQVREKQPGYMVYVDRSGGFIPAAKIQSYLRHLKSTLGDATCAKHIHVATATAEVIPSTIEIDGKSRPTQNSTGAPIHHSLDGIQNFWRWFGDSKVVDESGRPIVAYHGVGASGKFTTFNKSRIGASSGNMGHFGAGFYFAWNPKDAKIYSQQFHGTGELIECYIKMENPFYPDNDSLWGLGKKNPHLDVPDKEPSAIDGKDLLEQLRKKDVRVARIFEVLMEGGDSAWDTIKDENGGKLPDYPEWDVLDTLNDAADYVAADRFRGVPEHIIEEIRALGVEPKLVYDHPRDLRMEYLTDVGNRGAVWTEAMRKEGHDGVLAGDEIVVFEPDHIKSATDNSGEFNPSSTEITAGLEATAGKNNRRPEAPPQKKDKRIAHIFDSSRVPGITPSVLEYANRLLTLLSQGYSTFDIQQMDIMFGKKFVRPLIKKLAERQDLNCWYVRAIEPAFNKYWRIFFAVGQTSVAILDIYDKDDERLPMSEIEKLKVRSKSFAAQDKAP